MQKPAKFLIIFLMLICIGISCSSKDKNKATLSLSVEQESAVEGINTNSRSAANYYRLFREALNERKSGNHVRAKQLLFEALPNAVFGPEIAMVHHELAEMYMEEKDLKNELISRKQIAKYTANPDVRQENAQRAVDIEKTLNSNNRSDNVPIQTGRNPEGKH